MVRQVLITEFVEGMQAPPTPRMFAVLGACLGGLHERPGHRLPPGGAWHHLVPQGSPRDEIAAADGDPSARQTLLDQLRDLDGCADLPHAIVHPDFVPVNATLRPERGMVVVDWAGRHSWPRARRRHREHVQLTADELARLPDAIRARS